MRTYITYRHIQALKLWMEEENLTYRSASKLLGLNNNQIRRIMISEISRISEDTSKKLNPIFHKYIKEYDERQILINFYEEIIAQQVEEIASLRSRLG